MSALGPPAAACATPPTPTPARSSSCCAPASAPTSGASRRPRRPARGVGGRGLRPRHGRLARRGGRVGSPATRCLLGDDLLVAVHPGAAGPRHRHRDCARRGSGGPRSAARACCASSSPSPTRARASQLLDSGWWPVHHYFSLRMPLERAPRPADDVIVRQFDAAADLEPVWRLVQDTYASLEGFLAQPLEAWRATTLGKPGWDPALWLVLHDREGLAGVALGERGPRDTGLVHTLAVARARARPRARARAAPAAPRRVPQRRPDRRRRRACTGPTPARRRCSSPPG